MNNEQKIIKLLEEQGKILTTIVNLLNVKKKELKKSTKTLPSKKQKKANKEYVGLMGGIQLLIDNGFFKKPTLVTEVNEELKREGYFYTIQAVDTILRRDMVKRKKVLNRIKIDGVWQYILRK